MSDILCQPKVLTKLGSRPACQLNPLPAQCEETCVAQGNYALRHTRLTLTQLQPLVAPQPSQA